MSNLKYSIDLRISEIEKYAEYISALKDSISFGGGQTASDKRKVVKIGCSSLCIMLYSAIEVIFRAGISRIEREIEISGSRIGVLSAYWRHEYFKNEYLKKLQEGTNNFAIITSIVDDMFQDGLGATYKPKESRSGVNIGMSVLTKASRCLDLDYDPGRYACGADIETIRTRRNALAHGDDLFAEAGEVISIEDILDMIPRISKNLYDFADAIELYIQRRDFLQK